MNDEIKEINITYPGQILDYVDTKEHLLELFNYITNLQEELEYQKQAEQEYNEKHTKLMKKYKKLQERKDKAIKYLEQPYRDNFDYSKAELLNILNGGDE